MRAVSYGAEVCNLCQPSPRKVVTFGFCLIFKYRHVDTRLYAFYVIISFLK